MPSAQDRLSTIADDLWKEGASKASIMISIPQSLYNEFILRAGKSFDASSLIAEQAYYFLERTLGDPDIWSEEHADEVLDDEAIEERMKYGPSNRGLYWKSLFLPNGTKIRMTYRGKHRQAEIRHEKLMEGDQTFSPSQWASFVAGGTNRNAWRDLYINTPGSKTWTLAEIARREGQTGELARRTLADSNDVLAKLKKNLPEEAYKKIESQIREISND